MTCDDVERLVGAYVDGELALERMLALEAHVAECAVCRARIDRVRAVRQSLQATPYFRAPDALAARVRAAVGAPAAPVEPTAVRRAWQRWLVPAAGIAALLFVGVVSMRQRSSVADAGTIEAVIEGHVRSLMGDHLTDVASTDRHTVKPWFAGRVDFSPAVVDLASDGFPLAGGRLDYIDHHAAAALVYKRRDHAINVFLWPAPAGSPAHVTRADPRGYHVISWTRGGVAVWVVSDLAIDELDDFGRKLDAAMHAPT